MTTNRLDRRLHGAGLRSGQSHVIRWRDLGWDLYKKNPARLVELKEKIRATQGIPAGYDVVLVETVGVGQSEVEVAGDGAEHQPAAGAGIAEVQRLGRRTEARNTNTLYPPDAVRPALGGSAQRRQAEGKPV